MTYETEHDAKPSGQESAAPTEHPLEGGQTDAVDEAQEAAEDDPDYRRELPSLRDKGQNSARP